jgi:hypothetical protein
MLAAAKRYQDAYTTSLRHAATGQTVTHVEMEMHQATLGLMWATHTRTLQEALDALSDVESGHGSSSN